MIAIWILIAAIIGMDIYHYEQIQLGMVKPLFKQGECIKYNPDLVERWESTEGLPFLIREVGKTKYRLTLWHPKVGMTNFIWRIEYTNRDFVETDCNLELDMLSLSDMEDNK